MALNKVSGAIVPALHSRRTLGELLASANVVSADAYHSRAGAFTVHGKPVTIEWHATIDGKGEAMARLASPLGLHVRVIMFLFFGMAWSGCRKLTSDELQLVMGIDASYKMAVSALLAEDEPHDMLSLLSARDPETFRWQLRALAESPTENAERLVVFKEVWQQLSDDMKAAVWKDPDMLSRAAALCRDAEQPAQLLDLLPASSCRAMLLSRKCLGVVLEVLRDDLNRSKSLSAWLETMSRRENLSDMLGSLLGGNRTDLMLWRAILERVATIDDLRTLAAIYPHCYDDFIRRTLAKPGIATAVIAQLKEKLPSMAPADIVPLLQRNDHTLCPPLATYLWTSAAIRPLLKEKLSAAGEGSKDWVALLETHPLYQMIVERQDKHSSPPTDTLTPHAPTDPSHPHAGAG